MMMKQTFFALMGAMAVGAGFGGGAEAATSYLGSSTGSFGTVDTDTGVFTEIGNTGQFFDIATLNETTGYGITSSGNLFEIDLATAGTTLLGNAGSFINGLGFDDSGNLFGTGNGSLFSLDLGTGAASTVGSGVGSPFSSSGDIAYDGSQFFATSNDGANNSLWSINAITGVGTRIGDIGFESVFGLTYQDSTLFGFTASGDILTINTTTGAGLDIADVTGLPGFVTGASPTVATAVPEPTSLLGLLAVGALVTGAAVKRKQAPSVKA
ncbi:MAG: PEP-CTERM sorting domain-containing protein [Leptolyngbya sp. SIOISBB]|nr:PEP-CTERM sorting domain-containing protein [Leptolyngbya sp. SIOISBB]